MVDVCGHHHVPRQGVIMYAPDSELQTWELVEGKCSNAYGRRQQLGGSRDSSPCRSAISPVRVRAAHSSALLTLVRPAAGGFSPLRGSDASEPRLRRSSSDRELHKRDEEAGRWKVAHSPRPDRGRRRYESQASVTSRFFCAQDVDPAPPAGSRGGGTGLPNFANLQELSLLQALGQAVICTDAHGIITFWNRAAEKLYGWQGQEVVGLSVVHVLVPCRFMGDARHIISLVAQGDSWTGNYLCLRRDGVVLNTVVTNSPILDDRGNVVGIIGASIDANTISTDLHRAHAKAWQKPGSSHVEEVDENFGPRRLSGACQATQGLSKGSTSSSKSLLQLGCNSVQQLLRKLRGSKTPEGSTTPTPSEPTPRMKEDHDTLSMSRQNLPSVYGDVCSFDGIHSQVSPASAQRCVANFGSDAFPASPASGVRPPHAMGIELNPLSRTSSGSMPGSTSESPMVASVIGSPLNSSTNAPGGSVNFLQAEEDFQLQLALALRVAAQAAAAEDPDLVASVKAPMRSRTPLPGVSKVEATAYRYWVSNCLSYDDRVEDGFFEIWGMSPYVWSMCTDSNDLGRMPPLDSMRSVHPADAAFEAVLVDRSLDPDLCELEDKAIGLAYDSTEVLELASKLGKMVANAMGGMASSDEPLMGAWKVCVSQLMEEMASIVIPIGKLKTGLCRHRALLFKVIADSVGLPCRLVRGSSYCGKEDQAMVVVKCGEDKEWMINLLANPGQTMSPDARLAAPPTVIASPLQFERPSPFAGSSTSVMDWARPEPEHSNNSSGLTDDPCVSGNNDVRAAKIQPTGDNKSELSAVGAENAGQCRTSPLGTVITQEYEAGVVPRAVSENHPDGGGPNRLEALNQDPMPEKPMSQQSTGAARGSGRPVDNFTEGSEANINWVPLRSCLPVDSVTKEAKHPVMQTRKEEVGGETNSSKANVVDKMPVDPDGLEILWADITVGEKVGQGSYGKVYRADWQGSDVAVKIFLDQDLKVEALDQFRSEMAIMRRMRHPNVVLFMGAVTKPPNLSIVTEFCPRGSLFRLLHRPNREIDERRRIRMALDVAKGMNYLHKCTPPIVHRDLKSPNLLVDKNWTVKVCDFGLSRQKHNTFLSSKSSVGTPEWMAPEVLRNEPSDEKSDIYSFGVILWELATLQVPWGGMNPLQVVGAVGFQHSRLPISDRVDPSISSIILACWRSDPRSRPSFADILQQLKPLQRLTTNSQQNSLVFSRPQLIEPGRV